MTRFLLVALCAAVISSAARGDESAPIRMNYSLQRDLRAHDGNGELQRAERSALSWTIECKRLANRYEVRLLSLAAIPYENGEEVVPLRPEYGVLNEALEAGEKLVLAVERDRYRVRAGDIEVFGDDLEEIRLKLLRSEGRPLEHALTIYVLMFQEMVFFPFSTTNLAVGRRISSIDRLLDGEEDVRSTDHVPSMYTSLGPGLEGKATLVATGNVQLGGKTYHSWASVVTAEQGREVPISVRESRYTVVEAPGVDSDALPTYASKLTLTANRMD